MSLTDAQAQAHVARARPLRHDVGGRGPIPKIKNFKCHFRVSENSEQIFNPLGTTSA